MVGTVKVQLMGLFHSNKIHSTKKAGQHHKATIYFRLLEHLLFMDVRKPFSLNHSICYPALNLDARKQIDSRRLDSRRCSINSVIPTSVERKAFIRVFTSSD